MEATSTSKTIPKLSASTLELKNNYYVVPFEDSYHYYSVKIAEDSLDSPIMRFEKCPPVLLDGIVIVRKKVYEVSAKEILRGIIRKSREIKTEKRDNDGSTGTKSQPRAISGNPSKGIDPSTLLEETTSSDGQSGVIKASELEILQVANAAWEDQVGSLLDLIHSKEGGEWEIEDPAQS